VRERRRGRLLYIGDTEDAPLLSRTTVRQHPAFLRDADALRRAKSNVRFVTGRDGHFESSALTSHTGRVPRGQRKRTTDRNTVTVTTSGMLGNEDSLSLAS